jgi:ubiquinone/menaquinone biosynthesis C-methylase UbiE
MSDTLRPAALAFDTIAPLFDARFGEWLSVAAQRRAVRREVLRALPKNARVLELGGGTGEDAVWLAQNDFDITLTDVSPAMVDIARKKLASFGARAEIAAAEDLESFAKKHLHENAAFDTVFSNFAPLNCVEDLTPVVRGLARLIKPRGMALLVLFGTSSPGEIIVELLRGRPHQVLRRFKRTPAPARLGESRFTVKYHRARDLNRAMLPWFRVVSRTGIGIFVPPSAAEPWISSHPKLLNALEALDRVAAHPLAALGDHVLYQFVRTDVPAS